MLSRVRQLHLVARLLSDRMLIGQHRSRRVGQAIEFADFQDYVPGMDPRRIDWRMAGRSDRLVVRRHEAETEIPCAVVLDLSGDLATGAGGRHGLPPLRGTKAGMSITLAATMLYWLHRQGEPVGLSIVAGEGQRVSDLPPRRGRAHLQLAFMQLAATAPAGRAQLSTALAQVASHVRRRSLVVVVSDGMEEPSEWVPSLRAFARRGADLRFVHVWDRTELTLHNAPAGLYFSPEGGEVLPLDPSGARQEFAEVVAEWMQEVRAGVVQAGGRYLSAPTDAPLEATVMRVARGGVAGVETP